LKRLPVILIALCSLLISPLLLEGASQPSAARPAELSLLDSTPGRLLLELSVPDFTLEQMEIGAERYLSLTASGLSEGRGAPGQPSLPELGLLVGLPPTGDWSLQVMAVEGETLPLDHPIAPAVAPARLGSETDPFHPLSDPSVGAGGEADVLTPFSPVQADGTGWMRDLRVVQLRLRPFHYNPARGELEHIYRLVVEIRFEELEPRMLPQRDSWDDLFQQFVVNYDVARAWRSASGPSRTAAAAVNLPAMAPDSLKIELDADGLYQLNYTDLALAGFSLAGDPANLHLAVGGQQVPMLIEGAADGKWDDGDRILFYGQAAQSRFTDINVYWLYEDGSAGVRMAARAVNPDDGYAAASATYQATLHREQDLLYDSVYAEANGDHWYWTDLRDLQTGCPDTTQSYSFSLTHLSPAGDSARLRASLQGHTDGTHHLAVYVNDRWIGDIVWTGRTRKEAEFDLDAAWLAEGENQLRLENGACPDPADDQPPPNGMAFNYFAIDYPAERVVEESLLLFTGEAGDREYDVTGLAAAAGVVLLDIADPAAPVQLAGGRSDGSVFRFQDSATQPRRYLAAGPGAILSPLEAALDQTSNLLPTTAGANYVVIGYGDFLPATQPLLDLRSSQGLVVASVDIEDVYDEFSYGLLDPGAIRTFLGGLVPLPDYVLLVGDATIDYHNHLGNGWHSFVPAFPADIDPWLVETVSDHQLALVGDDALPLPDLHIGRLPVASIAQTQAVVAKIINYEKDPAFGPWSQQVLLVADNSDGGGLFAMLSDELYYDWISPELAKGRIYLTQNADESHEYDPAEPSQVEAARAAILRGFTAGKLVINYMGHSSHSQWAIERLLHRDDTVNLQNDGRLPVVLSLTCYTGAFQHPPYAPLDERLILEPNGGAVAAWGSTGEGVLLGHRYLAQGFHQAIADSDTITLGAAIYGGQAALYNRSIASSLFLLDTYVLLGDPAMPLGPDPAETADMIHVYLPLLFR